ncbi:MAG: 3-deoxy-manno-octulosonate cytidylyltransferase [Candidatus Schekmanbacteria bacterium]|nr:3-deoxy-manno-octulosonate cytidylyltransferase [Candidatus Schekmanbacteria bacterium]
MKACIVIPARFGSTRFPGKPLAKLRGKEIILHVAERASLSKEASSVIIATDDDRIASTVKDAGYSVVMTSPLHQSGTDRVAEAVKSVDAMIVVNLQGDEPLIDPALIDESIIYMKKEKDTPVCTFKRAITSEEELLNPNIVKVVTDKNNFALYFSRFPIPYERKKERNFGSYYKHIGIYTFNKNFLQDFTAIAPTRLEIAEGLEQLRILENGYRIKVLETTYSPLSIDTPEELDYVERILSLK